MTKRDFSSKIFFRFVFIFRTLYDGTGTNEGFTRAFVAETSGALFR